MVNGHQLNPPIGNGQLLAGQKEAPMLKEVEILGKMDAPTLVKVVEMLGTMDAPMINGVEMLGKPKNNVPSSYEK